MFIGFASYSSFEIQRCVLILSRGKHIDVVGRDMRNVLIYDKNGILSNPDGLDLST